MTATPLSSSRSLVGKTVLITGSTDGIGKHTATRLASMGATVLLHGRSQARLDEAKADIFRQVPDAMVETYMHDFISTRGALELATEVASKHEKLDILINNAGVFQQEKIVTEEGFESTFVINVLSTFILNIKLLPLLKRAQNARILNVSSISQSDIGRIDLNNLQFTKPGSWSSYDSYSLSKLCVAMLSHELALRINPSQVLILSCDPGTVNTKMLLQGWGRCGIDIEDANDEAILVTTEMGADMHGKYFVHARERSASADVYDEEKRRGLWNTLEKLSGIKLDCE